MRHDSHRGALWPVRTRPKADELRSSWMCRLALANGTDAKTFWLAACPGKYIWGRDLDKWVNRAFEEMVARKTGLPLSTIQATALQSLRGRLYNKHSSGRRMPWVMPIGLHYDGHHQLGPQFCPRCLTEDDEPYFRRRWRLSVTAVCLRHQVLLLDRCPRCGAGVNFHLNQRDERMKLIEQVMALCYSCRYDLRKEKQQRDRVPPTRRQVALQRVLQNGISSGVVMNGGGQEVPPLAYLAVLRKIIRMLIKAGRSESFREAAAEYFCVEPLGLGLAGGEKAFDTMEARSRLNLLTMSQSVLRAWPKHFVTFCKKTGLWGRRVERGRRLFIKEVNAALEGPKAGTSPAIEW